MKQKKKKKRKQKKKEKKRITEEKKSEGKEKENEEEIEEEEEGNENDEEDRNAAKEIEQVGEHKKKDEVKQGKGEEEGKEKEGEEKSKKDEEKEAEEQGAENAEAQSIGSNAEASTGLGRVLHLVEEREKTISLTNWAAGKRRNGQGPLDITGRHGPTVMGKRNLIHSKGKYGKSEKENNGLKETQSRSNNSPRTTGPILIENGGQRSTQGDSSGASYDNDRRGNMFRRPSSEEMADRRWRNSYFWYNAPFSPDHVCNSSNLHVMLSRAESKGGAAQGTSDSAIGKHMVMVRGWESAHYPGEYPYGGRKE